MSKRVMILWGAAGGGHRSAAQALADAVLELDPEAVITPVDVYSSEFSTFPVTLFPRAYSISVEYCPVLWRTFYKLTDSPRGFALFEQLCQPSVRPGLKEVLRSARPDIAVCVLGLGNTVRQAALELHYDLPIGIVVVDLVTLHQEWLFREAAWIALPTEEARRAAIEGGIDAQKTLTYGLPLRKMFWSQPPSREDLRRRLGLPANEPVVLVMGGSEGLGHIERIIKGLVDAPFGCHVVAAAGHNERLRTRLIHNTQGDPCTILGYVTNTSDWMWASDILITKAGPTTVAEAIQCGLPMILTGAIPGQEEGNLAFVLDHGLGLTATGVPDIVAAVRRILTDQALSDGIKQAMKRVRQPDAALRIAQLIMNTN